MTVYDLNRDELTMLKQQYLQEKQGNISYEELAFIDDYVSDDEVYTAYTGVQFSVDDFGVRDSEEEDMNVRVTIDIDLSKTDIDYAVTQVLNAIRGGDTQGYLTGCQFEITER